MSVINIVNTGVEVHMYTDGATWNDDDKFASFNTKVGIQPHLNMSVSLMGSKWFQRHIINAIGGTYSSFDDVVRTLVPFVQREFVTHKEKILEKCYPHFLLVFCGWSDWAEGCEAYALSNMDLTRPLYCIDAPAWTLVKLGSHSFFPHHDAVAERLSASPSASFEEMGSKIVDVQRSIKGLTPDGRRQGSAGGFVQHTTVRKDGITTRVIKRYPDVVGAPAVPDDDARCGIVVSDGGSVWTVAPNAVDNTKLADMPTAHLKGRVTAGDGDPEDLTQAQVRTFLGITSPGVDIITAASNAAQRAALQITAAGEAMALATSAAAQTALLDAVGGDAGSGGTKGLVPAPAAGSAAAGKFLKANGTWEAPAFAFPTGSVVNSAYAEYTASADLSANIPNDDTIPQITEGTEIATVTITPASASNKIRIRANIWGAHTGTSVMIAALFQDSTANALAAAAAISAFADVGHDSVYIEFEHSAASTASRVYRLRAGASSGTMRLNGSASARRYGGSSRCTLVVEEIKG